MTAAPLVSICIPTYNGERFLRPCLESALQQTVRDLEIKAGRRHIRLGWHLGWIEIRKYFCISNVV